MNHKKIAQPRFPELDSEYSCLRLPSAKWLKGDAYNFERSDQELIREVFSQKYRRPLFVLGSGVSASCGVPTMKQCFLFLRQALEKLESGVSPLEIEQDETIETIKHLAAATVGERVYRPAAARLLGELQSSKIDRLQHVWTSFCRGLLSGEISKQGGDGLSNQLGNLAPSATHEAICWFYDQFDALCISFNYDGLTCKALQQYLDTAYPGAKKKAFILDDSSSVRGFFGRDPGACGHFAVFKIRGDIFYAICRTSGCPSNGRRSSVYTFLGSSQMESRRASWANDVLKCPECEMERSLGISFPGLEEKERDTERVLKEFWRYAGAGLSAIFVLGLSGVWDESAIHSFLLIAQILDIPVFDVKPPRKSFDDEDKQFIAQLQESQYPDLRFRRIETYADLFVRGLAHTLKGLPFPHRKDKDGRYQDTEPLEPDKLWASEVDFCVQLPNQSFTVPSQSPFVSYHIAHDKEFRNLERFSQLGLKNYWWGDKTFGRHNRYLHSIGTARIASCWHKYLQEYLPKTTTQRRIDPDAENHFVMCAALLHDFGHLPFSHLFEEIFGELHWSADPARHDYSHVIAGREKISKLLDRKAEGVSFGQKLKELGYSTHDLTKLIEGRSGSPYLDAIINSPIDADKIDYIFRDSSTLKLGVRLMPKDVWLREFLEDQDLSPEGFIRLNRRSAIRFLELLQTRIALYSDFYLSPWMRAMEAIAATIVTEFCIRHTTAEMFNALQEKKLADPNPDWGPMKILLATTKIDAVYIDEIIEHAEEQQRTLEKTLLDKLLTSLIEAEDGPRTDERRIDYFKQLKELLGYFAASTSDESGITIRKLYQKLYLAGPFKVARSHEDRLREVVRNLRLTYPDGVIVAVAKSPKVRATAEGREYKRLGVIGENVLVPSKNPAKWTMNMDARFPLQLCDFRPLEQDYVTIVLLDPWCGERASGQYIRDVFIHCCREEGIVLDEVA